MSAFPPIAAGLLMGATGGFPPLICHPDLPREVSTDQFLVPRTFVEQWVENEQGENPFLGPGCNLVPAFRDGQPIGLKRFGIKPDSALDRLGLRNGDLLVEVNGEPLNSADKTLHLFEEVERMWNSGDGFEIVLSMRRKGMRRTIRYLVQ